jgi:catechol 2,3-dioxygenase-like lactoylglutathione lyase family enzyme/uncharacterized protein with PQ loop repeat
MEAAMSSEMIGWLASAVLVITLAYQVFNQWSAGTSQGVSPWLFVGQLIASGAFTAYSVLIDNRVFIVTNGLIALSAVTGLAVLLWHRRHKRDEPDACSDPELAGDALRWPAPGMLHHVGLSTHRWEESIEFYTNVLGGRDMLRFDENGSRVAMLDFNGGCRIELFETDRSPAPGGPPDADTDGSKAAPGALVHFSMAVDDVEAATRRAAARGAAVAEEPDTMRLARDETPEKGPQVTYSFIRGPSGELIELLSGRV